MRQFQGVKFRKAKGADYVRRLISRYNGEPYDAVSIGRVHIQMYVRDVGAWVHLCSKKTGAATIWGGHRWGVVPDSTPVTCSRCLKHPLIVARFAQDEEKARLALEAELAQIPDIEEFQ